MIFCKDHIVAVFGFLNISGDLRPGSCVVALSVAVSLSACGQPAPELPAAHMEAAATCFAAAVAEGGDTLTADQVNKAAHFLFLGAVNDGLASPTALQQGAALGNSLQDGIAAEGDPARYDAPCAKRFPQTVTGSFQQLPADSRDTRMMCYTLSTSLLQTYQSSGVTPPATTTAMHEKLDMSLMAELNAEVELNPAEVAGLAMRSMAKATGLGPVNEVISACGKRYGEA